MSEIIVVHGKPGSGKSTHSKRLALSQLDKRSVFHLSVGDHIRNVRTGLINSTNPNLNLKDSSKSGPESLDHKGVNTIVFEYISNCPAASVVLVDGYPRFVHAIGPFIKSIHDGNHVLLGCLNLNISDQTCMERLFGRGTRKGESLLTKEFITERLFVHSTYTVDSINYLGKISHLINIDAEPQIEVVWSSFCVAFIQLLSTNS